MNLKKEISNLPQCYKHFSLSQSDVYFDWCAENELKFANPSLILLNDFQNDFTTLEEFIGIISEEDLEELIKGLKGEKK